MLSLSSASFSFAPTTMAAPTTQRASVVMEVRVHPVGLGFKNARRETHVIPYFRPEKKPRISALHLKLSVASLTPPLASIFRRLPLISRRSR